MAPKVTSSSTRSKRKTAKPVTKGQSPQRDNRQKVSTATVTKSGDKPKGGARVTRSRDDAGLVAAPQKPTRQQSSPRPGGRVVVDESPKLTSRGALATTTTNKPTVSRRATGTSRPALPPGQRGGQPTTRSGAATPPRSSGGPVQQVRVRDVTGQPQVGGSGSRPALPAGGRGGATTPRPSSGGGVPRLPGAVRSGMGGLRAGLIGMVAAPVVDEIGRRLGTALGNSIRQAATPQRTGTSSGRTGRGGTTADRNTSNTNATAGRYIPGNQQVRPPAPKPTPKPTSSTGGTPTRAQSTQQRATQAPRSSNSGGTTSTSSRNTPAPTMPSVVKERRVSASTANRESGNYGTSRTNNPLIDDTMKARMRRREDATGVGPVKDGAQYAADVKGSTRGVGPVADGDKYSSNIKAKSDKLSPEEKRRIKERYS